MKRIYRGWFLSNTQDGQLQAVKGNQRIIGPTEQSIKEEIDRLSLEELMEDIDNE